MSYFFNNYPQIEYDLLKNKQPRTIQNILSRYKLLDILKNKTALYHKHDIEEDQSAQLIADKYYGDITLDWVIYITNDILDPLYDWPLGYYNFLNYIKSKYDTVESAMNTTHHYEWIYQTQSVLYDDTVVPEKIIKVDATTYAGLPVTDKRTVSNYTYEERENEKKRSIKVLDKIYLGLFLDEAKGIFV